MIADRGRAGSGQADVVAGDEIAARPAAADLDAVVVVSRDDVALASVVDARAARADHVVEGARLDRNAIAGEVGLAGTPGRPGAVRQGDLPGDIGADVIAGDNVVVCPGPVIQTPTSELPLMMLRSSASVDAVAVGADQVAVAPPLISTPVQLGIASVPVESVPISLPATVRGRTGAGDLDADAGVSRNDVALVGVSGP